MTCRARRKCQRCRKVAGALYTVWAESGSYEDRIELCGNCLSEHNRTAPELRGLRVAQGSEAFEVPTLKPALPSADSVRWFLRKLHSGPPKYASEADRVKARRSWGVPEAEAALAAQNGGGR